MSEKTIKICILFFILAFATFAILWHALSFATLSVPLMPPHATYPPAGFERHVPLEMDNAVWRVFEADKNEPLAAGATMQVNLAARFKLAGTFEAFETLKHERLAFIDDTLTHRQLMVAEGDMLDEEIIVSEIMTDRVTLRCGEINETLILSFSTGDAGHGLGRTAETRPGGRAEGNIGQMPLESRFGMQVDENRWVLNRNKIMAYYNDVINDIGRLGKVFDSMKPVYDEGGKITGYQLYIEAEKEMFEAFGLKEGDYIRKVNSLPMTSQTRAEYFIKEFAADRANAFVLELERQGRPLRLTYLIRND